MIGATSADAYTLVSCLNRLRLINYKVAVGLVFTLIGLLFTAVLLNMGLMT